MRNFLGLRDFSFVAIGRLAITFLQAIFYFLFATILNPDLYGQISYLIAVAGTASIVSLFGLQNSLVIYKSKKEFDLANQIMIMLLITTSLTSLFLLIFDWKIAFLSLAMSFFAINLHNFLAKRNYKNFMIYSFVKSSLILILPLLFYFTFDMIGIIIGMIIGNLVCGITFFHEIKFKTNSFLQLREKYRVLLHNFGIDSSTKLIRYIDKLFILPILGYTYVGIFQLNTQILFAIETIPLALYSFLLTEESSKIITSKISYLVIALSIILSLIGIFTAPYIIPVVFPDYVEGIISLQILLFAPLPFTLSLIFTAKLQLLESTRVGFSGIVQIVSLIILIIILGSMFELVGLSIAFVLSSILNTIFLSILLFKIKK